MARRAGRPAGGWFAATGSCLDRPVARDPGKWDVFLPHADPHRYDGAAGTTVVVGPEADGQIAMLLGNGPALFVSFDRTEDPDGPATTVDITLDWTRVAGPPAAGITPLVVAWTAGGGVLQLAPEERDPLGVAPGARVLGGPEFVLRVSPAEVPAWIDRLIRLPRRSVLDPRPVQLIWLGGRDRDGRLLLHRLRRTEYRLLLDPAGTAAVSDLAPPSPLVDLLPTLRARRAGATRAVGPAGRLTAELFAIESQDGADGRDQAADHVDTALRGLGWAWDEGAWPPVCRQVGDGVTRWYARHENLSRCPVPLQVPELAGASCWVERGELLTPPSPAAPPLPRRRRWWRR